MVKRKCFILLIVVLLLHILIDENISPGELVLVSLFAYFCGVFDATKREVKEPYVIGDSNEIVHLTKKELEERLKKERASLHEL